MSATVSTSSTDKQSLTHSIEAWLPSVSHAFSRQPGPRVPTQCSGSRLDHFFLERVFAFPVSYWEEDGGGLARRGCSAVTDLQTDIMTCGGKTIMRKSRKRTASQLEQPRFICPHPLCGRRCAASSISLSFGYSLVRAFRTDGLTVIGLCSFVELWRLKVHFRYHCGSTISV